MAVTKGRLHAGAGVARQPRVVVGHAAGERLKDAVKANVAGSTQADAFLRLGLLRRVSKKTLSPVVTSSQSQADDTCSASPVD